MTVHPPEQPIPRDRPCDHPVRDSTSGLCLVCDQPIPEETTK